MLTKRVHNYTVHPTTRQVQMLEVKPYVQLGHRDHGTVYLQDGHCFADAGDEVELPDWAAELMANLSPQTLRDVKFEPEPTPEASLPAPTPLYHCDECGQDIEMVRKGVHIAAHRRAARRGE